MIRTNSDCFLDTKRPVNFPLEDKHTINEHQLQQQQQQQQQDFIFTPIIITRKSHAATQEKNRS